MTSPAPFRCFTGTLDQCFKEIDYFDVYRNRHLPRYSFMTRSAPPLPEPLEVGCLSCGIKIIELEESGLCRVCDFADGLAAFRPFHSRILFNNEPLVVSRIYVPKVERPPSMIGDKLTYPGDESD